MSLTSQRLIASMAALALGALAITSCSQQPLPTAPTALRVAGGIQPAAEYWVTLFDETPPTSGTLEDPPPPPPAPGTPPSPWPPGPPPPAQPLVPVPTPPSTHPRLHIRILPSEQVLASNKPTGIYACRDHPYSWQYDQEIITDTGVAVTFGERVNFIDGRFSSKNTSRIAVPGNNSVIVHTTWCSSYQKPRYTQTKYFGADDYNDKIEFSGPWVQLLTP